MSHNSRRWSKEDENVISDAKPGRFNNSLRTKLVVDM
jgi:hypothetical protein